MIFVFTFMLCHLTNAKTTSHDGSKVIEFNVLLNIGYTLLSYISGSCEKSLLAFSLDVNLKMRSVYSFLSH